jgi:hypothetical protein
MGFLNGSIGKVVYTNWRKPWDSLPDVVNVMVEFPHYSGHHDLILGVTILDLWSDLPDYVTVAKEKKFQYNLDWHDHWSWRNEQKLWIQTSSSSMYCTIPCKMYRRLRSTKHRSRLCMVSFGSGQWSQNVSYSQHCNIEGMITWHLKTRKEELRLNVASTHKGHFATKTKERTVEQEL